MPGRLAASLPPVCRRAYRQSCARVCCRAQINAWPRPSCATPRPAPPQYNRRPAPPPVAAARLAQTRRLNRCRARHRGYRGGQDGRRWQSQCVWHGRFGRSPPRCWHPQTKQSRESRLRRFWPGRWCKRHECARYRLGGFAPSGQNQSLARPHRSRSPAHSGGWLRPLGRHTTSLFWARSPR